MIQIETAQQFSMAKTDDNGGYALLLQTDCIELKTLSSSKDRGKGGEVVVTLHSLLFVSGIY